MPRAAEPKHRHNGGPLSDEDAQKLWGHIRALEILDEQAQDIRDDQKARKELAKADGFDTAVVAAILKRRKNGHGETQTADMLVRIYEEALEDQGALPLEQTRITPAQRRRDVEEVAATLHGEPAPAMGENSPQDAAQSLDSTLRAHGATATLTTSDGREIAKFGVGGMFDPDDTDHKDPF